MIKIKGYCGHQFKFKLSKKQLAKITLIGSLIRFTDLDKIKEDKQ